MNPRTGTFPRPVGSVARWAAASFGAFWTALVAGAAIGDAPHRAPDLGVAAVWWTAALALVIGGWRPLPLQNRIAICLCAGGAGWILAAASVPPGIPAITAAGLGIVVTLGCRGAARWLVRSHRGQPRYGLWVLGVGVLLSVVLLVPALRTSGVIVSGSMAFAVTVWVAAFAGIHVLTTPWFLDKRVAVAEADPIPALLLAAVNVWAWWPG